MKVYVVWDVDSDDFGSGTIIGLFRKEEDAKRAAEEHDTNTGHSWKDAEVYQTNVYNSFDEWKNDE